MTADGNAREQLEESGTGRTGSQHTRPDSSQIASCGRGHLNPAPKAMSEAPDATPGPILHGARMGALPVVYRTSILLERSVASWLVRIFSRKGGKASATGVTGTT